MPTTLYAAPAWPAKLDYESQSYIVPGSQQAGGTGKSSETSAPTTGPLTICEQRSTEATRFVSSSSLEMPVLHPRPSLRPSKAAWPLVLTETVLAGALKSRRIRSSSRTTTNGSLMVRSTNAVSTWAAVWNLSFGQAVPEEGSWRPWAYGVSIDQVFESEPVLSHSHPSLQNGRSLILRCTHSRKCQSAFTIR